MVQNWRDQQGSELDKAKKLLASANNLTEIADRTHISRVSLSRYKAGKTDIDKASWSIVNRLSQMYDIEHVQTQLEQEDFFEFMNHFANWFDKAKAIDSAQPVQDSVNALSGMVKSDPVMMAELYKFYRS